MVSRNCPPFPFWPRPFWFPFGCAVGCPDGSPEAPAEGWSADMTSCSAVSTFASSTPSFSASAVASWVVSIPPLPWCSPFWPSPPGPPPWS